MATLDTPITKLLPAEFHGLAKILDHSKKWKKLMAIIPKESNEDQYMFTTDHFAMIEEAISQQKRSGAELLLEEWSTIGKKRPTCRLLLDLLVQAELFRAADYLAVDILKGNPPERPKFGPAAAIDVSEKVLEELLKQQAAEFQTESEHEDEPNMSWSMHFAEKPVSVIACNEENQKDELNRSDLMKFSIDKSDLMKFSVSNDEELQKLPEQFSDLMNFSNDSCKATDTPQPEAVENYVLQEALSAEIPLCVKDNVAFQSNEINSFKNKSTESETSLDTSDESGTMSSKQSDVSNVSQNIIPVVVLEYNG